MATITDKGAFVCCIEESLRNVKVESVATVHEASQHCIQYLNDSTVSKVAYVKKVFDVYLSNHTVALSGCQKKCDARVEVNHLLYFVFWITVFALGVSANVLVISAFFKSKRLRKKTNNCFIVSLACSDFFVLLSMTPYQMNLSLHNGLFCSSKYVCSLYMSANAAFFVASITNIFVIALDRFLAVWKPYRYKRIVNKIRVRIAIGFIWLYSVLWGVSETFNFREWKFQNVKIKDGKCALDSDISMFIQHIIVFYLPCIIMTFLYAFIFRVTLSHAKNIDAMRKSLHERHDEDRRRSSGFIQQFIESNVFTYKRAELRATKVVIVIYGTFVVCWLPVIFLITIDILFGYQSSSKGVYELCAVILPLLNSVLNPFIYGIMHRDFKSSLKRILRKIYARNIEAVWSRQKTVESGQTRPKSQQKAILKLSMGEESVAPPEESAQVESEAPVSGSSMRYADEDTSETTPPHNRLEQLIYSPAGQQCLNHTIYIPNNQSLDGMIAKEDSLVEECEKEEEEARSLLET